MNLRAVWVAAFTIVVGCGGPSGPPKHEGPGGTPTAKEALVNLGDMLKWHDEQKKRLPSKVADLEPIEPVFPGAYLGLVRGEITYHWGLSLRATEPGRVLAFENTAESDGGWVLFQDGAVKQITADELRAAPKAK